MNHGIRGIPRAPKVQHSSAWGNAPGTRIRRFPLALKGQHPAAEGCRPFQGSTFLCGRVPGALPRAEESQPFGLKNSAQARERAPCERTSFPRSLRAFATLEPHPIFQPSLARQPILGYMPSPHRARLRSAHGTGAPGRWSPNSEVPWRRQREVSSPSVFASICVHSRFNLIVPAKRGPGNVTILLSVCSVYSVVPPLSRKSFQNGYLPGDKYISCRGRYGTET
jgi:hypothetical protein